VLLMSAQTITQKVWTCWSEADNAAITAERAVVRAQETIAAQERGDDLHLVEELTLELGGDPSEVLTTMIRFVREEPNNEARLHRMTVELQRLRRLADALWDAYQVALCRPPETAVVSLKGAAEILGVDVRAAESALRRGEVRSGYPVSQVEWLRDNRPGRGARTDLNGATKPAK
jgi:hypothetical protein